MRTTIANHPSGRRQPVTGLGRDQVLRREVEVVETAILLPVALYDALASIAAEHELTFGQMTRLMIGLCMSPAVAPEVSRRADVIHRSGFDDPLPEDGRST